MIMPDTSTLEVRRVRISRRLVKIAIASGVLLVLLSIGALGHFVYMWDQARENVVLRTENEALRAHVETLDLRLDGIDRLVERVKQFDTKLRTITSISDPERHLAIGPVGGADTERREASLGPVGPLGPIPSVRGDLLGPLSRAVELVQARLSHVELDATSTAKSVSALSAYLEDQQALLSSTPSRAPARGFVTSTFGTRVDPFTGLSTLHPGIDFSANIGAPVSATADGLVIFAGSDGAYGRQIKIDHGNSLVTSYGHLAKMHVKLGESVKRGQLIGEIGNTGRSTGPHLHYEVRVNGIPQDPRRFLLE